MVIKRHNKKPAPSIVSRSRLQSPTEEIANSAVHGFGLVAMVVATPLLIRRAAAVGDPVFVAGVWVFCASAIVLYFCSSLYHALPAGRGKRFFLALDYYAIFLLIAGTYTPFTLGVLRGAWGWSLFAVIWGLAAAGILLKMFAASNNPVRTALPYLLMGWVIVIAIKPLIEMVPLSGLILLLAGGLFYSFGVLFYAGLSWVPFGHAVWHLFVCAGTGCHAVAIYRYGV
jgi:hemolysin III